MSSTNVPEGSEEMLIIPAIDIKDGKVVRLFRGNYSLKTIYSASPVDVAKKWDSYGVKLIHVVDLDGALEGRFRNMELVYDIAKAVKAKVELGGGVRDEETISKVLDNGVEKVVLGTILLDRDKAEHLVSRFGDRIVAAIDAEGGMVRTKAWIFETKMRATELARRLEEAGIGTINYTDISKDGTLAGPNLSGIEELLKSTKAKIVASGGISSIEDIKALKRFEKDGLAGVIIGKALYENRIDLAEALKAAEC